MSEDLRLAACLDLTRRMPPDTIEDTLADLVFLAEDLTEKLLANIELPFKTEKDTTNGRPFIQSDFNRDGDSYRSPYSNKYFPDLPDGVLPPSNLRELEVEANTIFDKYLQLYYDKGVSSVYSWEIPDGFAVCVLFKKDYSNSETHQQGFWNSSHFFRITKKGADAFDYNLTTTVTVSLGVNPIALTGKLVRKFKRENVRTPKTKDKVKQLGMMVEEAENNMRGHMENVYFGRVQGVIKSLRAKKQQIILH